MKFNTLAASLAAAIAGGIAAVAPAVRRLPDRLSTDPRSPFYDKAALYTTLIQFNDQWRDNDVHAYDAIEGWIDVRIRDRKGRFIRSKDGEWLTERLYGKVVPVAKHAPAPQRTPVAADTPVVDHFKAAEEKRARKAAKAAKTAKAARDAERAALSKFQGGYVTRAGLGEKSS